MVTDVVIQFVSRAHAREELLFEVGCYDKNNYGGDMGIQVTRMNDGSVVARGKFGFVCYNYIENAVSPMTPKMLELFSDDDFVL